MDAYGRGADRAATRSGPGPEQGQQSHSGKPRLDESALAGCWAMVAVRN